MLSSRSKISTNGSEWTLWQAVVHFKTSYQMSAKIRVSIFKMTMLNNACQIKRPIPEQVDKVAVNGALDPLTKI